MQTKICTGCGKEKSIDEFYKAITNKDGYNNKCKNCIILQTRKYRKNNPEKEKLLQKKYQKENKVKIAAYKKNWVQENKDHVNKEAKRRHHERRKSDFRYKIKENLQSLFRESFRKQNLKKEMPLHKYTGFDIEYYCSHLKKSKYSKDYLKKNKIEIDHIIPCSVYNYNDIEDIKMCWHPDNIQLLTKKENREKHAKIDIDLIKKHKIEHLLPKNYTCS